MTTTGHQVVNAIRAYLSKTGRKWGQLNGDEVAMIVNEAGIGKPKKVERFAIPTPQEVEEYSQSIGYPLNGQAWCDTYAAKDWMVGRTRMKNWQAAVRNWKTNGWVTGADKAHSIPSAGFSPAPAHERPASLGALQMQLKRVESDLDDIWYPGGCSFKQVPTGEKKRISDELLAQRAEIKRRLADYASPRIETRERAEPVGIGEAL